MRCVLDLGNGDGDRLLAFASERRPSGPEHVDELSLEGHEREQGERVRVGRQTAKDTKLLHVFYMFLKIW